MQRDISGRGGEVPVVMAAAVALASSAALVASGLGQLLSFLFQQLVQRLLRTAADQFFGLALDIFLVKLYNPLGHGLLPPLECMCGNFILPETANRVLYFLLSLNLRN